MDRAAFVQKLKEKKGLIALVVSTAVVAGAAGVVVPKLLASKHPAAHTSASHDQAEEAAEEAANDTADDAADDAAEAHGGTHASKKSKKKSEQKSDSHSEKKAHAKSNKHEKHEKHEKKESKHAHAAPHAPTWVDRFNEAWIETRGKIREIKSAMEENEKLRIENAALQIKAESLKFDCSYREATHKTHEAESRLVKETGSKVGRSLSSITYSPPTHLLPPQLYVLGVSYFKAKEDEKAAVIMTFLTGLEESDAYKTAKDYLMTGVSWYRLDNFEVADQYFAKAIETKELTENLPYQAQARLWRGLVAQSMAQRSKAQFWLRDLIDHHPHSAEAGWINPSSKEARRVPASAPKHP